MPSDERTGLHMDVVYEQSVLHQAVLVVLIVTVFAEHAKVRAVLRINIQCDTFTYSALQNRWSLQTNILNAYHWHLQCSNLGWEICWRDGCRADPRRYHQILGFVKAWSLQRSALTRLTVLWLARTQAHGLHKKSIAALCLDPNNCVSTYSHWEEPGASLTRSNFRFIASTKNIHAQRNVVFVTCCHRVI